MDSFNFFNRRACKCCESWNFHYNVGEFMTVEGNLQWKIMHIKMHIHVYLYCNTHTYMVHIPVDFCMKVSGELNSEIIINM